MASPREALDRLCSAADSGELDQVCRRYDAELLVAFGSTLREAGDPRDLDVAVLFIADGPQPDLLGFLDALGRIADTTTLDLMDLERAGPVARERALVGGRPLVELIPGAFARQQMRAITERMDTAWLRQLDLELMAR